MQEKTNLYRVMAQTIEWVYGATNIEFGVQWVKLSIVEPEDDKPIYYPFEIKTNTRRLTGITHPLALVAEHLYLVITGIVVAHSGNIDFGETRQTKLEDWDKDIAEIARMELQADRGGYVTISVQHRIGRHDGGEETMARHFLFRHNLLHKVR